MSRRSEKGQAILLVVLAFGLVLLGALGLAIDGAQLYGNREMAQVAADAAAQAGILSIFNGTNTGSNAFGSAAYTCSTTDATTPCRFARNNGFGGTTADTVFIEFPSSASAVGLDPASLSASDPVNMLKVTVSRNVTIGMIRMLGAANTASIKAVAVAAIVAVETPTPMIITHPNLPHSLSTNGNTTIQICGTDAEHPGQFGGSARLRVSESRWQLPARNRPVPRRASGPGELQRGDRRGFRCLRRRARQPGIGFARHNGSLCGALVTRAGSSERGVRSSGTAPSATSDDR